MAIMVCGPHRQTTGLLEMEGNGNRNKIATWDNVKGIIDTYTPDYKKMEEEGSKELTFKKKSYQAKDFSRIELTITAGDVIQMQGYAYAKDGEALEELVFSGPATGSFSLSPVEPKYVTDMILGKNDKYKIIEE